MKNDKPRQQRSPGRARHSTHRLSALEPSPYPRVPSDNKMTALRQSASPCPAPRNLPSPPSVPHPRVLQRCCPPSPPCSSSAGRCAHWLRGGECGVSAVTRGAAQPTPGRDSCLRPAPRALPCSHHARPKPSPLPRTEKRLCLGPSQSRLRRHVEGCAQKLLRVLPDTPVTPSPKMRLSGGGVCSSASTRRQGPSAN